MGTIPPSLLLLGLLASVTGEEPCPDAGCKADVKMKGERAQGRWPWNMATLEAAEAMGVVTLEEWRKLG